ncbi:MAG: M48 family metalloprotease [Alphaproteobacteria bacterium]|nr:M48 family metalloprotease [Alphaproteobacteria bacterium]
MKKSRHIIAISVTASLFLSALPGCTTNPATGESVFTGMSSDAQELRVGREQHPQIIKAFGGEFGSPELRRYVDSIGQLLARTVERKTFKYTFTLLNSEVVNAFALPGGYIYISRGLMALAENEAEVAGVLAHELGHINALHHGRREGQGLLANILLTGVGVAVGGPAADLGSLVVGGALRAYSREHELESDSLALRYMSRAGYDPQAMVNFLRKMRASSRLEARRLGKSPDKVDEFNYLATHPAPAERVRLASQQATKYKVKKPMRARNIYLRKINGMLFGDDPNQGFIRGRVFSHPKLKFRFEVPEGFRLFNTPKAVFAKGPNDATIIFDSAKRSADGPITYYLQEIWGRNAGLRNVQRLDINGLDAATGVIRQRGQTIRAIAIRKDLHTIYRFMFRTKSQDTRKLSKPFRRTTHSFRILTKREIRALKPLRVRVVRTRRGDTVASMARRMAGDDGFSEARFRVLNGLHDNARLRPGQRVKIVTE